MGKVVKSMPGLGDLVRKGRGQGLWTQLRGVCRQLLADELRPGTMMNEPVKESQNLRMQPKPESLWWTGTYGKEGNTDLITRGAECSCFVPFVE